ncbi:MAG TPA: M56 family metallopeptidase [Rhodanobacteraceae bacterium]|nr:M56 family metallopeptidase [Rhodanobacteraceae bacterium]
MAELLLRMLAGATLGLAVVLLLRRPARWAFGAGPAFTLWLLPILLALAPLLPNRLVPAAIILLPELTVTPHFTPAATAQPVVVGLAQILIALWLLGATIGVIRLAVHYFKLLRGLGAAPPAWIPILAEAEPRLDPIRMRVHGAGPAVLWALPRSLILLPADFPDRFDSIAMREVVLRHELTHAHRGDAWWTLAMEIACALLWFHPLAWFARPRFRLDQELACDAASLRACPKRTANYAHALLDSVAVQPAPALIPWLTEPQLKERIAMLTRTPPGALRRRAGFIAIAVLLAGGLYVAGGQMPAEASTQRAATSKLPSVDIASRNSNPPRYPVDAIKNGEQGTVMLRIHVNPEGQITRVDVDRSKTTTASAELQAAAVTAAENWKFNPGIRNGKPVGGWITSPVSFSLANNVGQCPEGESHDLKPPFKCVPRQSAAKSS